jgi:hypothetical protein
MIESGRVAPNTQDATAISTARLTVTTHSMQVAVSAYRPNPSGANRQPLYYKHVSVVATHLAAGGSLPACPRSLAGVQRSSGRWRAAGLDTK